MEFMDLQLKLMENKMTESNVSQNHALVLKIADEITRMETNLSRMDSSVRGYKQLMASIKRIKDNFLSYGYELVDMLGKDFKDGMRVNADFVFDEEIEKNKRIITTVIKPQVNYNGEMIQKASVIISQNI